MTAGVRLQRRQHGDRVDTRLAQPRRIAEPRHDRPRRLAPGGDADRRGSASRGCAAARSRAGSAAAPPTLRGSRSHVAGQCLARQAALRAPAPRTPRRRPPAGALASRARAAARAPRARARQVAARDPRVERRPLARPRVTGCARRNTSRWVKPSRSRYLSVWYASSRTGLASYQARHAAAQPASPAAQLLDVRAEREQVRTGAADAAAAPRPAPQRRVASSPSPAHAASAKIAGCAFGARPPAESAIRRATTRGPSSRIASTRLVAFSEREPLLAGVVGAALAAEDDEAVDARPAVERKDVAAAVAAHLRVGERCDLGRSRDTAAEQPREQLHDEIPPFGIGWYGHGEEALSSRASGCRGHIRTANHAKPDSNRVYRDNRNCRPANGLVGEWCPRASFRSSRSTRLSYARSSQAMRGTAGFEPAATILSEITSSVRPTSRFGQNETETGRAYRSPRFHTEDEHETRGLPRGGLAPAEREVHRQRNAPGAFRSGDRCESCVLLHDVSPSSRLREGYDYCQVPPPRRLRGAAPWRGWRRSARRSARRSRCRRSPTSPSSRWDWRSSRWLAGRARSGCWCRPTR